MANSLLLAFLSLFALSIKANAQSFYGFYGVVSNAGEQALLAKGNMQILDTVRREIKHQTKTAVIQNVMAAEFTKMKKWEKQYNKYLKMPRISLHLSKLLLIYMIAE